MLVMLDLPQGFPLSRANWSFAAFLDYSWQRFRSEWLMLSLAALLTTVVSLGASFVQVIPQTMIERMDAPIIGLVLIVPLYVGNVLLQGLVALGMYRVALDVLQGLRADPVRVFSQARKLGRFVIQAFVMLALVLAWGAACMVLAVIVLFARGGLVALENIVRGTPTGDAAEPYLLVSALLLAMVGFVYLLFPLWFAPIELALSDRIGPIDALRNSFAVLRGRRFTALGTILASAVVGAIGTLACCVGFFPAYGLVMLLWAGMYLALRDGAALPFPDEPRPAVPAPSLDEQVR